MATCQLVLKNVTEEDDGSEDGEMWTCHLGYEEGVFFHYFIVPCPGIVKWTENVKAEDEFAGVRMVLATEGEVPDIGCRVENTRYVGEIDWLMEGNVIEDDFVTDVKKTSGSNSLFTLEEVFWQPALKEWEGKSLLCRYSQKDHNDVIIHQDTVEAVIVYVKADSDAG